jgi:hypothetical protein
MFIVLMPGEYGDEHTGPFPTTDAARTWVCTQAPSWSPYPTSVTWTEGGGRMVARVQHRPHPGFSAITLIEPVIEPLVPPEHARKPSLRTGH